MIRALVEFVRAAGNLLWVKVRGAVKPCPPHQYEDGIEFCKKCGQYRSAD